MSELLPVDHPRFCRVERDIFVKRVTPDCMNFECRLVKQDNRLKLDACCQYGVDADLAERDAILSHADELRAILIPEAAAQPWFTTQVSEDVDFPSGGFVRTTRHGEGCVFLAHDGRGCAIHRASLAGGWNFHGIKPHVCRLFPLSYDHDSIVISDDYSDYSCALVADAPTLYRVGRADLGSIFGEELVEALDRVEAAVAERRLAVAS